MRSVRLNSWRWQKINGESLHRSSLSQRAETFLQSTLPFFGRADLRLHRIPFEGDLEIQFKYTYDSAREMAQVAGIFFFEPFIARIRKQCAPEFEFFEFDHQTSQFKRKKTVSDLPEVPNPAALSEAFMKTLVTEAVRHFRAA